MKKGTWLRVVLALVLAVGGLSSGAWAQTQQTPLPGSSIPQWVNQLPTLAAAGGTMENVVLPSSTTTTTLYMKEFLSQVLPGGTAAFLPGYTGTSVFGYRTDPTTASADTYIGPVFVASRGIPTAVQYVNKLGSTTTTNVGVWKTSVDQTLHWANPAGVSMMTMTP